MSLSPPWPEEMDGVIAAPDHHRVLFENEEVRVIETIVPAGATTPLHTHPKTVMYVVSGGDFVRRDESGNIMLDTREAATEFSTRSLLWSEGRPAHSVENPSNKDLVIIGVELKV